MQTPRFPVILSHALQRAVQRTAYATFEVFLHKRWQKNEF